MKKYIALPLVLLFGILVASCSDTTTNPPPVETGSIFINSSPVNAEILIDGTSTGKFTPDSVTSLSAGNYMVSLNLDGYRDTTISADVVVNQQTTKFVQLVSSLAPYGPVRIYETSGTTVNQPSGLDLSSGITYGVSGADKNLVDIYYSTPGTGGQGYLVQSADLNTTQGLTRHTGFYVGGGADINDGENSPNSALSGWTDHMSDRESNYVFLYDEDGHYSKLIITDWHAGSGQGDPSWVEVKWLFNKTGADRRF